MNNIISEPTKTQLRKYNELKSMMKGFARRVCEADSRGYASENHNKLS